MTPEKPPVIATWFLDHLTPGANTDDLRGDLAEEFSRGRSGAWFWRQVLGAIAIGFGRELRRSMPGVVFALLWSVLAPVWWFYVERSRQLLTLFNDSIALPFPYSAFCLFLIQIGPDLAFIWLGMMLFALLHSSVGRSQILHRLPSRFAISTLVFLTAFYSCGYLLDLRLFTLNVTLRSLFTEHQFLLYRLPFLLTLLLCIRTMRPSVANEVPKSIA